MLNKEADVVVIGYGSVKRANLAGAVTDISAQELEDIPVVNLSSALEGRLSGVRISVPSGKPGAATQFQIRESASRQVEEGPLYVIDGIFRDKDAFDILDPSEVESISILKDASAAVYGASAAGGVVLVTTKKGKSGKIKVNYTGSYGITQAINTTDMLSAYDQAVMVNDGLVYKYPTLYENNALDKASEYFTEDELIYFRDSLPNGGYDWLDGLWRNAMITRHSLNLNGGNDKTSYFVGGSYIQETGNIESLYIKKYNLRSNVETQITKNLTLSVELSANFKNNKTPVNPQDKEGDIMETTFKALLQNPKFIPPEVKGYPVKQNDLIANNPYGILDYNNYKKGDLNSFTTTGSLNYKIPFIKGLTAKIQVSQTQVNEYSKTYKVQPKSYLFVTSGSNNHIIKSDADFALDTAGNLQPQIFTGEESFQESIERSSRYQTNLSLSYNATFGKHEINALIVNEFSESAGNKVGWTRTGNQLVEGYDNEWAFPINDEALSTNRDEKGDIGYIGRLNYNYASKYIGEFAFRYQASSNFSKRFRWGFFPSVLIGWVVSEEKFFEPVLPVMSFLKFRASAGILGNDNIGDYQYLLAFKTDPSNTFLFGDQQQSIMNAQYGGLVNEQIKWQTSYNYNGGVDMRFLENRIGFSFDAFYELTTNMLEEMKNLLPTTTGVDSKTKFNYGKAEAYGYEIELTYNQKFPYDINFEIGGNFSWSEKKWLKVAQSLAAEGRWDDYTKNDPSNQPGAFCTGMIRDDEEISTILMDNPNYMIGEEFIEKGMLNYKDLGSKEYKDGPNGEYSFDLDADRRVIAQKTTPPYIYGANLQLSWKGLKVSATFSGKFGHKAFFDKEAIKVATPKANVPTFWIDHWTPDNPDAAYPRANLYGLYDDQKNEGQLSTFWMRNGHTLRMTDLSLSYGLPSAWSNYLGISSLRVFFNTKNLWTIINPFDYKDASLSNYNGYPITRTYNFGVNLSL